MNLEIGNIKFKYREGTADEIQVRDKNHFDTYAIPEFIPKENNVIIDIGAHI